MKAVILTKVVIYALEQLSLYTDNDIDNMVVQYIRDLLHLER